MAEIDQGGIEQCSTPRSGIGVQYFLISFAPQAVHRVRDCCHFIDDAISAVTSVAAVAAVAAIAAIAAVTAIAASLP